MSLTLLLQLARRMKLSRLGDNRLRYACGGRAIELMAAENVTDSHLFDLPSPRSGDRDCDFSFTGIHLAAERLIKRLETEQRGGVAANSVIRTGLSLVADLNDVPLIAPPARLCTDNGVMIAWNGLLLQRVGSRIVYDPSQIDFEPRRIAYVYLPFLGAFSWKLWLHG
ncbi:hypothetical protein AHF37_10936 [Paragonimus kellicotti]|nr:hypothetical protein AHF37_10936 [Paragonimus kellicotti]